MACPIKGVYKVYRNPKRERRNEVTKN